VACCVTRENVGPHNDTRFKHLRLASGHPARRSLSQGPKGDGWSLRVQKGSLRELAKILQGQCDGQSRALHSARFMWSKWCEIIFIIRALNAREENSAQDSGSVYTSEGPSGSFGVPQSRGVESLIRGVFQMVLARPINQSGHDTAS